MQEVVEEAEGIRVAVKTTIRTETASTATAVATGEVVVVGGTTMVATAGEEEVEVVNGTAEVAAGNSTKKV